MRFCTPRRLVAALALVIVMAGCTATPSVDQAGPGGDAVPAETPDTAPSGRTPDSTPAPALTEPEATDPELTDEFARPEPTPGRFWQLNGYANAVEPIISARFGIDGAPPPLASVFHSGDPDATAELNECFDREIRSRLTDDIVDGPDVDGPSERVTEAGIDALFACVPAEQIRTAALEAQVAGWNWYVRPEPVPLRTPTEPCVQEILPTDPDEFRSVWTNGLRTTEGTCLGPVGFREPASLPAAEAAPTESGASLAGRRGLTLQWISWEPGDWGAIEFAPLGDERYEVGGRQDGPDGDFVVIDGTATRISDTELRFEGWVVTRVSYVNDGAICSRFGEMQFLATEGRQFWRMQDQLNCDDVSSDYVDIYFG